MLFVDAAHRWARRSRSAILSVAVWASLHGVAPAQGSGSSLWVPLDTQPEGTPARVVLNTDLSTPEQTYFDLYISGFYVVTRLGDDGRMYQDIRVPGLPSLDTTGEPALPVARAELGIVTTATGATLLDATVYDLRSFSNYLIWPSPIPAQVHDGAPWQFVRDDNTYASPLDYPAANGVGGVTRPALGGIPASLCTAYPVHWNPASGVLSVAAHARFGFGHGGGLTTPMGLTKEHASGAEATLLNWGEVSSDYAIDPFHYNGDFLFVCPVGWTGTLQSLIQEKKTRGFKVTVITVPLNGVTCSQLQQVIATWYAGTPPGNDHYAILAGPLSATPYCRGGGGQISDKLLSSVNGDAEPEIYLGRLLVANQAELLNQVNRILDYETGPQVNNDGTVLLVAHQEQDQYFDFPGYQDLVLTMPYAQVTPSFITVYGNNPSMGNADVTSAINAGVGVVDYIGHGGKTEWLHWSSSNANFTNTDAMALSNGVKTPVIWSIACDTGDLGVNPSLATGFMTNTNGGGVAFYGAVSETFGDVTSVMQDSLFQAVYGRGITRHGPAIDFAEHAAIAAQPQWGFDAVYKYVLYGDPEMSIKRHNAGGIWAPIDFLVPIDVIGPCPGIDCCPSCPAPTIDLQTRSESGAPIAGVKVGIWKPSLAGADQVLDNRYSGPDGWVHIPAPGLTPGTLYVGYDDGDGRAGLDSIEVLPGPTTGVAGPGARPLHLTARPNVSSGSTLFAFGRTLDHAAKLVVFDVGGRLVRTLNARAGAAFVEWDGRDGGGHSVGAGVYLARLVAGESRSTARLVMVR